MDLTEQGSATLIVCVCSHSVHRIMHRAIAGKRTKHGIIRSSSLLVGRVEMNEHRSCGEKR